MKKYLIDTDVLIAHLRESSKSLLQATFIDESVVCYYSAGELLQGARNKKELRIIQDFLGEFSIHWGSEAVNRKAIALLTKYSSSVGLHMSDAIIAATAQEKKLQLVTKNKKHFRAITEIQICTDWSP